MKLQSVWLDTSLCDGCGRCVGACPRKIIRMAPGGGGVHAELTNISRCAACGSCALICPKGAFTVYEE